MSTELMTKQTSDVQTVSWTAEQVDLIKRTIAVGATNDELQLFLYQAKRTGLDPLSRQIHFVKRKEKGTIQTAIDGYRLIADRTGKYAGSDDYRFDEGLPQYTHMVSERGNPTTATATVYKMIDGVRTPFTATAAWGEYFPGEAQGFMWKKMPYLMIGKCAEALALRKAFPAELSGVYTNEEMMQADAEPRRETRAVEVPSQAEPLAPNYGPYAKQPLSQIPYEGLSNYLQGTERSISDPAKAKFKAANERMREAIKSELANRQAHDAAYALEQQASMEPANTLSNTPDAQALTPDPLPASTPQGEHGSSGPSTMTMGNTCQQLRLCESIAEAASIMNAWLDESHSQADNEQVNKVFTETKRRLGKR